MAVKVFVYMGGNQRVPQGVTHVRIHKSVKIITARAFMNCRNLVSIEMHDGVEIIEEMAFCRCTSLRGIKLIGVREIEEWAFAGCALLADIDFGDKLDTIGRTVFAYCFSLRNINPKKVKVTALSRQSLGIDPHLGYMSRLRTQEKKVRSAIIARILDANPSKTYVNWVDHYNEFKELWPYSYLSDEGLPMSPDDSYKIYSRRMEKLFKEMRKERRRANELYRPIDDTTYNDGSEDGLNDGAGNSVVRMDIKINNSPSGTRKRKEAASSAADHDTIFKRKKYFCSVEECSNQVQHGGVCWRHGAKNTRKLCSRNGCYNYVHSGGVCIRHGERCKVAQCTNKTKGRGLSFRHGAYSENNQGDGNHSNVATATTNNSSSNFPSGREGGQQGIGMAMNHNFGPAAQSNGFCPPTIQSGFFQHSNAPSGNQQIEPTAETSDNEDDATMDNPSFDQSEESNHQDDPKKQATVHDNLMSCREEDETGLKTYSAGAESNTINNDSISQSVPSISAEAGPSQEDVELCEGKKDDNGWGREDQNEVFHVVEIGLKSDVPEEFAAGARLSAEPKENEVIETLQGGEHGAVEKAIGDELAQMIGQKDAELSALKSKLNEEQSVLTEKRQLVINQRASLDDLIEQKRLLEETCKRQATELVEMKSQSESCARDVTEKLERKDEEINQLKSEVTEKDDETNKLKSDVENMKSQYQMMESRQKEVEAKNATIIDQIELNAEEISNLQAKNAEKDDVIALLKSNVESLNGEHLKRDAKEQEIAAELKAKTFNLQEKAKLASQYKTELELKAEEISDLQAKNVEKDDVIAQLKSNVEISNGEHLKRDAKEQEIAVELKVKTFNLQEKAELASQYKTELELKAEEISDLQAKNVEKDDVIAQLKSEAARHDSIISQKDAELTELMFSRLTRSSRTRQQNDSLATTCELDAAKKKIAELEAKLKGQEAKKKGKEDDAKAEKNELRDALSGTVVTEKPNVTWADVAGLSMAKQSLVETVILPTRFPQLFTGKRRPFRGILLYGPPGTGKSYLAKAVATEADSTFFSVSSADLVSKWQGESERLVRELFQMARESAGNKAIIFIDEVDSLCASRSEGESDSSRRIKTEFLVQMDGVGKNEDNVLVLAATNVPWELDAAIRRRFEKRIYIPLPEAEARSRMVKLHLGDTPNSLSENNFYELGRLTKGASGSDLKVLVKEALMEPLRRCQKAEQFMQVGNFLMPCEQYPNCPYCPTEASSDRTRECKKCKAIRMKLWDVPSEKLKAPDIGVKDFTLRGSVSSVSEEEMGKYTEWTKQFGQEGT